MLLMGCLHSLHVSSCLLAHDCAELSIWFACCLSTRSAHAHARHNCRWDCCYLRPCLYSLTQGYGCLNFCFTCHTCMRPARHAHARQDCRWYCCYLRPCLTIRKGLLACTRHGTLLLLAFAPGVSSLCSKNSVDAHACRLEAMGGRCAWPLPAYT
jgi:hypothetical protein